MDGCLSRFLYHCVSEPRTGRRQSVSSSNTNQTGCEMVRPDFLPVTLRSISRYRERRSLRPSLRPAFLLIQSPLFPGTVLFVADLHTSCSLTWSLWFRNSLRFQRSHIDREAVLHIGLKQSLESFVDLLDRDHFDIRSDVVVSAEIQHLLS